MAQPWKHPTTGAYYLRRQIPEPLRPAFDGKSLFKVSLRTKDYVKATKLFIGANAELEGKFEEARERLAATGDSRPSQQDLCNELVAEYFEGGAPDGGLDGPERLMLAFLEGDRLINRALKDNGLPGYEPPSSFVRWMELASSTAIFQAQPSVTSLPESQPGKLWKMYCGPGKLEEARSVHGRRLVSQIASHMRLTSADMPEGLAKAAIKYMDERPLEHERRRRKPRQVVSRLRPTMRLRELFAEWKAGNKPTAKTAMEAERSMDDFIDYTGDIPVAEIVNDDLLNWRDEVARMPKSMPREDRSLPFTDRLKKHGDTGPTVSPTTVKKRIGGIQALLTYAEEQKWIPQNVGRGTSVVGYSKTGGGNRRIFQDGELAGLFSSDLFIQPQGWRIEASISYCTLYWLFLIGFTSGARIEEIGQAALSDVKVDGGILYIDIDDYVVDEEAESKSVKTDNSRRLVPIHRNVIALGFQSYIDALKDAGHTQLFPELQPNSLGVRTQGASQKANRLIDRHVGKDRRLVFHSFRHTFKNKGGSARITDRILDQLCGHAPTSVGSKYGYGQPLSVLDEDLHKIDFSCIDWQRLRDEAAVIDWAFVASRLRRRETSKIP